MSVTVAVVGLLSGLALPGHCWSRPLSYQTITQSVTSPGWVPTGDLNTPRYGHTATLLPNGKVLVAGGTTRAGNRYTLARSAELYDPDTGTWSHTAELNAPRVFHTATLHLVWYAVAGLPPEQRKKPVYVIASDTFVETPVIVDYIDENLEAINRAFEAPLAEGLRFERRLFQSLFATHDQKEGMAAFVEKRKPKFENR